MANASILIRAHRRSYAARVCLSGSVVSPVCQVFPVGASLTEILDKPRKRLQGTRSSRVQLAMHVQMGRSRHSVCNVSLTVSTALTRTPFHRVGIFDFAFVSSTAAFNLKRKELSSLLKDDAGAGA